VVLPLLLSLFLWDPAWNHYALECVPVHSLLGALAFWRIWRLEVSGPVMRWLAISSLGAVLTTGPLQLRSRLTDPGWNGPRPEAGQSWLMLDPAMNILSGSEPACGIVDPFNVYGKHALLAADFARELNRFHVDVNDLIRCLEEEPGILIALGQWGGWFVDNELQTYLDSLPPERFVDLSGIQMSGP
jgi:hypothetical protein